MPLWVGRGIGASSALGSAGTRRAGSRQNRVGPRPQLLLLTRPPLHPILVALDWLCGLKPHPEGRRMSKWTLIHARSSGRTQCRLRQCLQETNIRGKTNLCAGGHDTGDHHHSSWFPCLGSKFHVVGNVHGVVHELSSCSSSTRLFSKVRPGPGLDG